MIIELGLIVTASCAWNRIVHLLRADEFQSPIWKHAMSRSAQNIIEIATLRRAEIVNFTQFHELA